VDLDRRGFTVTVHRRESGSPVGQVIGQSPEGGSKVDKGSAVTLQVSGGPGTVEVPLVTGLTEATATKALTRRGLNTDSTHKYSSTVPKGEVISSSPPDGTTVTKGSRVHLVISSGPQQVKVPDVTNQDTAAAHSAIHNAGLEYTDDQVNSDQPKGTVIAQNPAGGTSVNKGTSVTLTISKGPNTATVPSVMGESPDQATSTLQGLGFQVQVKNKSTTNQNENGIVIQQRPKKGTKLKKGRTVVLYVGQFQQPTPPGSPTTPAEPTPTSPSG
jgi:eukaryotic-like serine/threonine-protein kinase